MGDFNLFGFDSGINNAFNLKAVKDKAVWTYNIITELPASVQINIWGMNPDGQPDRTGVLGDADGDMVLDRLSPMSLTPNFLNVTEIPPPPHLAWQISVDGSTNKFVLNPVGNRVIQLIIFIIMWIIPLATAAPAVWLYTFS